MLLDLMSTSCAYYRFSTMRISLTIDDLPLSLTRMTRVKMRASVIILVDNFLRYFMIDSIVV